MVYRSIDYILKRYNSSYLKRYLAHPKIVYVIVFQITNLRNRLSYLMICYVIWLFVKRLSQEAIQRRSQRDRLVKIKVFKLRRDADDIPCNITLQCRRRVIPECRTNHSKGPILG